MYDSCEVATSPDGCASRLQRMAGAGFKVVQNMRLFGGGVTDQAVLGFADAAQAAGVKVIWPLNALHDDQARIDHVIPLVRHHPATWGYYVADEPSPQAHDAVATLSNHVKALDPEHPRIVMGCGLCYGGEQSVSFLSDIDATLGTDVYPVREQRPDLPVVGQAVGDAAAGLRRVADRAGRKTVIALQAWNWGDSYYDAQTVGLLPSKTRFPTRAEIQAQRDAAIEQGHPDLILWYTLSQVIGTEPGQALWYWTTPSDPAQRWSNLVGGAFAGRGDASAGDTPTGAAPATSAVKRSGPRARFKIRATRSGRAMRVTLDARRSAAGSGRIVRYRWYRVSETGRSARARPLCVARRCSLRLARARKLTVELVVSNSAGRAATQRHSARLRD
jgi:hypothetical protein